MDKLWGKMTQSILENNHIRIPIHKRFFLSFIEGDETNISKEKLLHDLDKHGFIEDDKKAIDKYRDAHKEHWLKLVGSVDFDLIEEGDLEETPISPNLLD